MLALCTFNNRKLQGLLIAALVISGIGGCTKTRELGHRVLLNVDGKEMTASVFADRLALKLKNLDALTAKDPKVIRRAKEDLVRDFIITVLTENYAKSAGLFVKAEDLDAMAAKVRKDYPDESTFQKVLAEQNLTYKDWKESLSKSLLQKMVAQELSKKVGQPSPEEVKHYFETNKDNFERPEQIQIRQIVSATESDARAIETELKKGRSLSELAEKHSIAPEGKDKKGLVGWVDKGSFEAFETGFALKVGQRSSIVKSPFGYHIFEVLAKRPSTHLNFDQAKGLIEKQLMANREQAVFTSWLESELRKSRVLRDDDLLNQMKIETIGE